MTTEKNRNLMIVMLQKDILFDLGQLGATLGAEAAMEKHNCSMGSILTRHISGDWGNVAKADGNANRRAIKTGKRIHSVYRIAKDCSLWVITEWDRSRTTVFLANEY